jgi:uncharacterized radical SAM superfamily protein
VADDRIGLRRLLDTSLMITTIIDESSFVIRDIIIIELIAVGLGLGVGAGVEVEVEVGVEVEVEVELTVLVIIIIVDAIIVRVEAADVLEVELEVAVVIEARNRGARGAVVRRRGTVRVEVRAEVKLVSIDRICSTNFWTNIFFILFTLYIRNHFSITDIF